MSELKNLLAKGKKRGFLYKKEILDILPSDIADLEQIGIIMDMIEDMNIEVSDSNEIVDKA
jgi:hypothetical protein